LAHLTIHVVLISKTSVACNRSHLAVLYQRQTPDGKRARSIGNGAEITGIDWTVNHKVGKGNEQSFIRGMSSMQLGRGHTPKLYPDGNTCNWGESSTWNMTKLYNKAIELKRHLKKMNVKKTS